MSTTTPGVFFQCQRCGNCCRWPGDVFVDDDEVSAIAAHLEMDESDFIEKFTRLRANRRGLSLVEKPNQECIFLDGIECTIQPVKPRQCRGFPNEWNFAGWQKYCEAVPVAVPLQDPRPDGATPQPDQAPRDK